MSSSDSPPNSSQAVRNLRAKFEEHSASSPDRGRSPTTSRHASTDGSNASQTRNTVRASFVTVEPVKPVVDDRRITPEACTGSTAHKRRDSFSMDQKADFKAMAELRGTISSELERRRKSTLIETVPEVAVVTPAIERGESELFPKMKKPVERPSALSKQEVAGNDAVESGDDSSRLASEAERLTSEEHTPSPEKQEDSSPEKPQEADSQKVEKPAADKGKASVKEPTTTPSSAGSKNTNSPSTGGSVVKRKSGASRVPAPSSGIRATAGKTTRPTSGSSAAKNIKSPVTPSLARKPSTRETARSRPLSQVIKSEGQNTTSTSSGTRARARTKSPTRPVKLPQSVTASTASSVAKTSTTSTPNGSTTRPGPARTPSGTTQNTTNIRRQPSKREPTKPVTSRGASSSTAGANRALPQRPAESGIPKRQPSKSVRNTSGEGFLARMMRPTVSSASKVHEKPTHAPKSGPGNEHATVGKTKQTEQGKGETGTVKPARSSRTVSARTSDGREQATETKGQDTESREKKVSKSDGQDLGSMEQGSEHQEQVAENEEQGSESMETHEEVTVDGNMHPTNEETTDHGITDEGQDGQDAEPPHK
ncbi:MAG: hypothetical protein M1816_000557 [Peltula sp. TS41687]|nr:MAG: hypothetical protein M1816_000557 [Peltula sp. TS41687]